MKSRAHLLHLGSLLLGALLFAFIVQREGAAALWERVRALPLAFGWVLLVAGIRPLTRAYAWLRCLPLAERRPAGRLLWQLWRARLIGDAVGNLTMAGPLLAEPARLAFLGGGVSLTAATASLSLELLSYLLSACLVMAAGFVALLSYVALDATWRLVSWLSLFALAAAMVLLVAGFVGRWSLVAAVRRATAPLAARLNRASTQQQRWARVIVRAQQLEQHILEFYRRSPRDFAHVVVAEAAFHGLGLLEIWLCLRLLRVEANGLAVFVFEAVNRFINMAFAFVPVRLGVDEASTAMLAQTLGLATISGVTLALYRKVRVLFWTLIGLLLLLLARKPRLAQAD